MFPETKPHSSLLREGGQQLCPPRGRVGGRAAMELRAGAAWEEFGFGSEATWSLSGHCSQDWPLALGVPL